MIDAVLAHYYARRPVNATFTGVHRYDHLLPDWSPEGLATLAREMRQLRADLAQVDRAALRPYPDRVDLELADDFLAIQLAEIESGHFYQKNPSLAVGEAVFSIIGLLTRPFAPLEPRLEAAAARMRALPAFLAGARASLDPSRMPATWAARARREITGALRFVGPGLDVLLRSAADELPESLVLDVRAAASGSAAAFAAFDEWLVEAVDDEAGRASGEPRADDLACGTDLFDLLLARGHREVRDRAALLPRAWAALDEARAALARALDEHRFASWAEAQAALAERHPTVDGYLDAFAACWQRCRTAAESHDVVTWPDAPIRYVPMPRHTRDAAPFLYYLFYRCPAPFDPAATYDYVVTPVERDMPPDEQRRRLEACNDSTITLNHVVHHGGLGHHVQNGYASRAPSQIGRIAAVDCASRIGMFSGGGLAEGWACYAVDLMDELGVLTPLESLAQQHTRLRIAARAVADIELHQRSFTPDQVVALYRDVVCMAPGAAHAEMVKNGMFPATAIMYWLGTGAVHALRERVRAREGAAFTLRAFHDRFLRHGALPVPVIASLMDVDAAAGDHAGSTG